MPAFPGGTGAGVTCMSLVEKSRNGEESTQVLPRESACHDVFQRACRSLAGGDSSTMRVLPYHFPLVAERGRGSRVWDADGREYLDLNMAYGPLIFGHRPEFLAKAVCKQISERGSQLGFPTELSARVAEKIKLLMPSMQLMRFANSGTEAIASAIRLARVYTGRPKIILFEGNYHGWSDAVFHNSRKSGTNRSPPFKFPN